MNRFKKMKLVSLLVALTMAFGLIPLVSPQVASADFTSAIGDISTQVEAVNYWLVNKDSGGLTAVNHAESVFSGMTSASIPSSVWTTWLPLNSTITDRFPGPDHVASAEADIGKMLIDIEREKYAHDTASVLSALFTIYGSDKDTMSKLLGPSVSIDDFGTFITTIQGTGLQTSLGSNWQNVMKSTGINGAVIATLNGAMGAAAGSTVANALTNPPLGWSLTKLEAAEIAIDQAADPSFAGEIALLKAYVRSQTTASTYPTTPVIAEQSFSLGRGGQFKILAFGNDITGDLTLDSSNTAVAFTKTGGQFTVTGASAAGTSEITAYLSDKSTDWVYKANVTVTSGPSGPGGPGSPPPVNSTTGSATVTPAAGGTVSLGSNASITIPAGALNGTDGVTVAIQQASNPPSATSGFRLLGTVYDFTIGGQDHYTFSKPVTLTFTFDPAALFPGETPVIEYYDTASQQWVSLSGTVSGNTITITVDHFTEYGVFVKEVAPPPVPAQVFADVQASYWASDAINELSSLGYVSGYPDGTFGPDNKITRAEFISIISRALKLPAYSPAAPGFSDVASGDWFYGSVESALFAGLVKGYGSNFQPNAPITREEVATVLVNALGKADEAKSKMNDKTGLTDDASIAAWARGFVVVASQDGLIKGYPDGSFAPKRDATRAEACVMISKLLALQKKS